MRLRARGSLQLLKHDCSLRQFCILKNQIKMLNLIMNIHDWSASALSIKLLQNVIAASTGPVSVISFYVYVIQTNFALVDSNG